MDVAADGDRVLLHRLEQADWVLGVARLISSASTICEKDRARLKLEHATAVGQLHDDVGADDVGRHQVGRELDAVEVERDRIGQRAHQKRLAQTRHAFQQRMAADEQAGQDAMDDLVVADDHLGDLRLDLFIRGAEFIGAGFHRFWGGHQRGSFRRSDCS